MRYDATLIKLDHRQCMRSANLYQLRQKRSFLCGVHFHRDRKRRSKTRRRPMEGPDNEVNNPARFYKYARISIPGAPNVFCTDSHMTTRPVVPRMPLSRTACPPARLVNKSARHEERWERETRVDRVITGGEHVKGNDDNNNTDNAVVARVKPRATSERRWCDCFPRALRSSIVTRARSLHRRRYRSIATLLESRTHAAPHATVGAFLANDRSASLPYPLSSAASDIGPRVESLWTSVWWIISLKQFRSQTNTRYFASSHFTLQCMSEPALIDLKKKKKDIL